MSGLCPRIETCSVTISREEFLATCTKDWRNCPLISWKRPKQWMEHLGVEALSSRVALRTSREAWDGFD